MIALLLACLASPDLDTCLKQVLHGPGPIVVMFSEPEAKHPLPSLFRLGDGVCMRTHHKGVFTIICIG